MALALQPYAIRVMIAGIASFFTLGLWTLPSYLVVLVPQSKFCYNTCFFKGKLQNHKWENALTVDGGSWGYRRNVDINSYLNISQLIYQLASTVR